VTRIILRASTFDKSAYPGGCVDHKDVGDKTMVMSSPQQMYRSAVLAINNGFEEEGRNILIDVVTLQPKNEAAWMLLSSVVETPRERMGCLRKVLDLNPHNLSAQQALAELEQGPGAHGSGRLKAISAESDVDAPMPATVEEFRNELRSNQPQTASRSVPVVKSFRRPSIKLPAKQRNSSRRITPVQVAALVGLSLIFILGVGYVGFFVFPNLRSSSKKPALTSEALASLLPSDTPSPTPKATRTSTPTRTIKSSPTASFSNQSGDEIPTGADPRDWVLTQADLGEDYQLVVEDTGYLTQASLAVLQPDRSETLASLDDVGWVKGYQAAYQYGSSQSRQFTNTAELLDSSSSAQRYLDALHSQALASGWDESDIQDIGDASYAYTRLVQTDGKNAIKWQTCQVLVREHNTLISVYFSAPEGEMPESEAWVIAALSADRVNSQPSEVAHSTVETLLPPVTPNLSGPTPTRGPTPDILQQTRKIGPMVDQNDYTYTLQIKISGGSYSAGTTLERPAQDSQFILINLEILNLGPGTAGGIGSAGFQLKDAQGVRHDPARLNFASSCFLDSIFLAVQGSVTGCVAFEAPKIGKLVLTFQPLVTDPFHVVSITIRE
jgi:hypothetical protein